MSRLMAARWRAAQNARPNFEVQYVLSAMSSQEPEEFFAASRISLIWRSPAVRAPRFISATKFAAVSARSFPRLFCELRHTLPERHVGGSADKNIQFRDCRPSACLSLRPAPFHH